jgi:hypothetical protein
VANYTNSGAVYVSEEIYGKFSMINKVALYVHEVFYAMYRIRNAHLEVFNSRDSRKLTAILLGDAPDITQLKNLFKLHIILKSCGIDGSISQRIENCSLIERQSLKDYILVSRFSDGREILKDALTGLIWGYSSPSKLIYAEAQQYCQEKFLSEHRIKGVKWKLPTLNQVFSSPLRKLPFADKNSWFWSADSDPQYLDFKLQYNSELKTRVANPSALEKVLCTTSET